MTWPFSLPKPLETSRWLKRERLSDVYNDYKHVIIVEQDVELWNRFGTYFEVDQTLNQWCQENGCYYFYERVSYNHYNSKWISDTFAGADRFFIVTNWDDSAVIVQLRWG